MRDELVLPLRSEAPLDRPSLNYKRYLFMSCLQNEAILEQIHDEVWEEFRISNKLTDDQLNELCWANESGTLLAIETETNKRFEDMCQ